MAAEAPSEGDPGNQLTLDLAGEKTVKLRPGQTYFIKVKGLGSTVQFKVMYDPDDPDRTDNEATLQADDGSYHKVVRCEDGADIEGGKLLLFERVKPGKKYSLQIDPGPPGQPYYVFKGQPFTDELVSKVKHHKGPGA